MTTKHTYKITQKNSSIYDTPFITSVYENAVYNLMVSIYHDVNCLKYYGFDANISKVIDNYSIIEANKYGHIVGIYQLDENEWIIKKKEIKHRNILNNCYIDDVIHELRVKTKTDVKQPSSNIIENEFSRVLSNTNKIVNKVNEPKQKLFDVSCIKKSGCPTNNIQTKIGDVAPHKIVEPVSKEALCMLEGDRKAYFDQKFKKKSKEVQSDTSDEENVSCDDDDDDDETSSEYGIYDQESINCDTDDPTNEDDGEFNEDTLKKKIDQLAAIKAQKEKEILEYNKMHAEVQDEMATQLCAISARQNEIKRKKEEEEEKMRIFESDLKIYHKMKKQIAEATDQQNEFTEDKALNHPLFGHKFKVFQIMEKDKQLDNQNKDEMYKKFTHLLEIEEKDKEI